MKNNFINGLAKEEIARAKLMIVRSCGRWECYVNQSIMGIFKFPHHFMKKGEGNA